MSLDDDLRQAIANNLTAEVGTRLKERLDQADVDAGRIDQLEKQNKEYELKHSRWEIHRKEVDALDDREKLTTDRERQLDLREAVMDVQEKYATAARDDMMKVVECVFKGPAQRLAFDLQGGLSGLMNASGMSQSPYANLSGSIETKDDG